MANSNLTNAKRIKNDEFYTQYGDIQKEIEAYVEYDPDAFRGKVVYCNCDDPYEGAFALGEGKRPRANLKKRYTTIKKSGRSLWMFNCINPDQLPSIELYKK